MKYRLRQRHHKPESQVTVEIVDRKCAAVKEEAEQQDKAPPTVTAVGQRVIVLNLKPLATDPSNGTRSSGRMNVSGL